MHLCCLYMIASSCITLMVNSVSWKKKCEGLYNGHFKKDINVKSEIGVMLPSSFDGNDSDELTIEQIVHGPPEYSQWEEKIDP